MRILCLAAVVIFLAGPVGAAEPGLPLSLVRNGGFERSGGWSLGPAELVSDGHSGKCLRVRGPGGASQEVLVPARDQVFSAAVDVKTQEVRPESGSVGYAFAAVYQTDEAGRLVACRDFLQQTGTQGWQRHTLTFSVHPRAEFVSLRCGLFQAQGTAWFDNWTLVPGDQARQMSQVRQPVRRSDRAGGVAAIFQEPGMPVRGAASSPATITRILQQAGLQTRFISAAAVSDPAVLAPSEIDLLVIPTGRTFPAAARLSLVEFLRGGGDLITLGGYAFNDLVRKVDGQWVSERQRVREERLQRTSAENSLLSDGGFEEADEGHWRRTSPQCTVVEESPHEGRRCARIENPLDHPAAAAGQFVLDLPARPQTVYEASGWMRTAEVTGQGMAFFAVYQYDAGDRLVEHCDYAVVRGTTDWHRHSYVFTPKPGVVRLHLKCGLYNAHGAAWFDDVRLVDITGVEFKPINTSTGEPHDGLEISPAQIGIFDPSFPLKRACRLRTAPGQHVVREAIDIEVDLVGWAASGVIGSDDARWIPLVASYDRYGRQRGAAAAMVLNYGGVYGGSWWAYFGVENVDLFADPDGPLARALGQVARFMTRKLCLHNLRTDQRLYLPGEPVKASVVVDNRGPAAQSAVLRFVLAQADASEPAAVIERQVTLQPQTSQTLEAVLGKLDGHEFCRITAVLMLDGEPIDEVTAGSAVRRPETVASAPQLHFRDNYFTLDGRPTFLFGSDTYGRVYTSAAENPLTWSEEISAARDIGMNLYEILQPTRPGHTFEERDWREFHALGQLVQEHGLVFMPGMLIGHNVAIGDSRLAEQSQLCSEYARRFREYPALLYYINGDYHMRLEEHPQEVRELWNRWLAERYGSTERLRAAWGAQAVTAEMGTLEFPPPNSGRWDDVAAVDRMRFQTWLTRRWNESHVAAIRAQGGERPITSEYYQRPFGGLDLVLSIDGQDVSNIGYFDQPGKDIDNLPLKVRWNDLRARGKGVSLGEYGVKTHPAWAVDNGGRGYHIVRTEEEQSQLFLAVAHYGLGLGVSKVQNWCLRDAQARVFPWGLFYPNQLVPKDVAYAHRNQSIVWRHFRPRHTAPPLTVCLANQLRLGNDESVGTVVADRTFADLLALHYPMNVIDDHHLEQLPPETRILVYPSPMAVSDEAYQRLLAWVRSGGTLLVTGDFSRDADRQPTRTARLAELAGGEWIGANYSNVARSQGSDARAEFSLRGLAPQIVRPCLRVKPAGAEVLGRTAQGHPVLLRHQVGKGKVYYLTDPIELADGEEAQKARRSIYGALLRAIGAKPVRLKPDVPWIHAIEQPTERGVVHVVYNTRREEGSQEIMLSTAAGEVKLATRNRWPALAAATDDGRLIAVHAYGSAAINGRPVMRGAGLKILLALDGMDLRQSEAVLVAPFAPGEVELPGRSGRWIAAIGEFQGGKWTVLEKVPVADRMILDLDADRATSLVLLCRPETEQRWSAQLTEALLHPERIAGY